MGRCTSQGSLKLFPWYVIQLSGACDPVFSRVSSRFTTGNGCNLMTARRQVFSLLSLLSWVFSLSWVDLGFTSSHWRASIVDSISQVFPSWSGIWPIFGRHFMIKLCFMVLWGSSQIRQNFLMHHSRCEILDIRPPWIVKDSLDSV